MQQPYAMPQAPFTQPTRPPRRSTIKIVLGVPLLLGAIFCALCTQEAFSTASDQRASAQHDLAAADAALREGDSATYERLRSHGTATYMSTGADAHTHEAEEEQRQGYLFGGGTVVTAALGLALLVDGVRRKPRG